MMRRAINSTEVARRAGVSRTTVSFVLNGRDDAQKIPLATRERVLHAAQELGYQPNHLARALVSGRSYMICLLVRRVHPAFYSRAIAAFYAALQGSGYDLRVQETAGWAPAQWGEATGDRWPVDGIIAIEETYCLPPLIASLDGRTPLVNVGASYRVDVDYVGIDLFAGTTAAIDHLVATGRTHIGWLGGEGMEYTSRYQAYEAAMLRRGWPLLTITPAPANPLSSRTLAYAAVGAFLTGGGKVDALVCFNDEFAIGALRAIRERGLRVPGDIALVGCDDIEEAGYHDPPLSTQHYPYDHAARTAWEMLRRRIENPGLPIQSCLLVPDLIVRGSSSA